MTRLIPAFMLAVLFVALCCVHHRIHGLATGAATPSVVSGSVRVVEPSPASVPSHMWHSRRSDPHRTCTDTHWRSFLKPAERWIDQRESGLDPAAVEPTTGAYGLGQLLASTYAVLGLTVSSSPCREIAAQRACKNERYGSWSNAKAHELAVGWW